ncbi:hypothetical protein [Cohnella sp. JJ-181]|uniref:hypothetical protein n=1 Tax=Cohnella rhizoplanae TaxID=2974897 RepID=UPI0022FF764A|nr:hypothetical protein [Cohnella sp. JJ-181]CAI6082514.1 hypothetical protein COHCIP112018_03670 [Cohnella sp. JJ-181]
MSKQTSTDENGVLLTSSCRKPKPKKHRKPRKPCGCKPRHKHKKPHRDPHSSHRHHSGGGAPVQPEPILPEVDGLGGLGSLGGIGSLGGLEGGLGWGAEAGLGGLGGLGGPGGSGPETGGGHRSHHPHRSRGASQGTATTYSRKKR